MKKNVYMVSSLGMITMDDRGQDYLPNQWFPVTIVSSLVATSYHVQ